MNVFRLLTATVFAGITLLSFGCNKSDAPTEQPDNIIVTLKTVTQTTSGVTASAVFMQMSGSNAPTEAGFRYREASASEWSTVRATEPASPFSATLTTLLASTEYVFTAYVVVADNVFTSAEKSFTTEVANPNDHTPDPSTVDWRELPEVASGDTVQFVTHFSTLSGRTARNYSMLYDNRYHVAHWVAYPLHQCYTGDSGRSDAWQFDPIIPEENQVDLSRAGYVDKNGYSTYDRGHQIPSADRTISNEVNAPTFFFTNMTPQQSTLNQNLWAKMEIFVRKNICKDTLFVVTGCVMTTAENPTVLYATPSNGGRVAVPRAYFKVIMRTAGGNTGALPTDANAVCLGFWHNNEVPSSSTLNKSMAVSVSEIEQRTGFTFFPTLSSATKSKLSTSSWTW